MLVVGLTGSIGMGKSATAAMLRARGVPVHDADGAVHRLYAGAAVPLVEAAFPGTTRDGAVDRTLLSARVLGDAAAMARLEALVHPLARADADAFLDKAARAGHGLAVLDVPLLFETGGEGRCDVILVVSATEAVQKARVLARPGMTPERLAAILARQLPDPEKRRRAHHVVATDRGFPAAERSVEGFIKALRGMSGRVMAARSGRPETRREA